MEREIGVEAGLWSVEDVEAWADSPLRDEMRRVLVELPDAISEDAVVELARPMIGGIRAVSPEIRTPQPYSAGMTFRSVRTEASREVERRLSMAASDAPTPAKCASTS